MQLEQKYKKTAMRIRSFFTTCKDMLKDILSRFGIIEMRPGDWRCKGCNFLLFADKNHCYKCNLDRNGNKIQKKRQGDWYCKGCNFLIYASKNSCVKCNMDKNGNPLDDEDKIKDDNLCTICFSQPKNTIFLHKDSNDAHQICCYACAYNVKDTNGKCPMCMQLIDKIIKVYN